MPRKIETILKEVKPLAVEYHDVTGKPLGVTGEISEFEAARLLDLELLAARSDYRRQARRQETKEIP